MHKVRIGLIFGGLSKEREISKLSAENVSANLDRNKYLVRLIEIKPGNIPVDELDKIDLALIMVHGPGGEDGTIQGLLELKRKKYTGSNVMASAVAMNKRVVKDLVGRHGVKTPAYYLANEEKSIKLPGNRFVVKPANIGSSLGISIVTATDLAGAIKKARRFDKEVLVEQYIQGREFTVPVLGNKHLEAFPVIEIRPKANSFFDYESKYKIGGAEEIVPANISKGLTSKLQEAAMKVHRILGCGGMTRSDFIVDGKSQIYFLEINTIPGMTKNSLVPKSAAAAGVSMTEVLDKIISLA